MNDVSLDELEFDNVEAELLSTTGTTSVGQLVFSDITPDQNMTTVRCRAQNERSAVSKLLLQGMNLGTVLVDTCT